MLLVRAICPGCKTKIESQNVLDEESLVTGNTTQRAAYWAKQMKEQVQASADRRGWTAQMCGKCRDQP
jgi:hypothetical protein